MQKKERKAERSSFSVRMPKHQDVPGVKISGVSSLESGRSCQDVANRTLIAVELL